MDIPTMVNLVSVVLIVGDSLKSVLTYWSLDYKGTLHATSLQGFGYGDVVYIFEKGCQESLKGLTTEAE